MDRALLLPVPEGLYGPGTWRPGKALRPRDRALFGLKQSVQLWHQIETYLVVPNVSLLLCMFVKRFGDEFAIIVV